MNSTLREAPATARRILVVANEAANSDKVVETLAARAADEAIEVLVIAPALNTRLHHWMSDEDGAHHAAGERLAACLQTLNAAGIEAQGWVGDADPVFAIADAIPFFAPEEIVLLTLPMSRSNWLERDVVARTRGRFGLPVTHLVVWEATEQRGPLPVAA
jgi:GABA permease